MMTNSTPESRAAQRAEGTGAVSAPQKHSWWGFAAGPIAGLALALLLPDSLSFEGRAAAGCALLMAIWWMTEAVPIAVTSLLPLVLFPLFGMATLGEVAAPYASGIIFLVMGGVILGLAVERSGLHRRVALLTIRTVGTKPAQMVLGLIITSAFISAWVSNTATAVIMVPIALSIVRLVRSIDPVIGDTKFGVSMLLGVAYGVTIGSTATLIGQPPMAYMRAYLSEEQGIDIPFAQWMAVGVPWAILMSALAWLILAKIVFRTQNRTLPGGRDLIRDELHKLGRTSTAEKRVAIIFLAAIFFWVAVPFIADIPWVAETIPFLSLIEDPQVAMAAAVATFIIPAERRKTDPSQAALLPWSASKEIPWGLLLLFGGGLSLSSMFGVTGLSVWIGERVEGLSALPPIVIILAVMIIGIVLTELTSNTATSAAFLPIMGAVAVGVGIDPVFMTMAMTLAVCSAYMLPVATPSNAVAFGSGEVSIRQMAKAGVWLNLISIPVIVLMLYTLVPLVFGVSL